MTKRTLTTVPGLDYTWISFATTSGSTCPSPATHSTDVHDGMIKDGDHGKQAVLDDGEERRKRHGGGRRKSLAIVFASTSPPSSTAYVPPAALPGAELVSVVANADEQPSVRNHDKLEEPLISGHNSLGEGSEHVVNGTKRTHRVVAAEGEDATHSSLGEGSGHVVKKTKKARKVVAAVDEEPSGALW